MGTVKIEIEQAITTLNLKPAEISLVADVKTLYLDLLKHFVKSGDRKWWWEDFKQDSFNFIEYEFPFKQIINILPKNIDAIWLMVEDDQEEYYPIYNCKPAVISELIGECSAFEYYVIDKNKQWLLCENHSDRLIGIGEELKAINISRLQ